MLHIFSYYIVANIVWVHFRNSFPFKRFIVTVKCFAALWDQAYFACFKFVILLMSILVWKNDAHKPLFSSCVFNLCTKTNVSISPTKYIPLYSIGDEKCLGLQYNLFKISYINTSMSFYFVKKVKCMAINYNILMLLGIITLYMFLQSATQHKYPVFVIYIALINLY